MPEEIEEIPVNSDQDDWMVILFETRVGLYSRYLPFSSNNSQTLESFILHVLSRTADVALIWRMSDNCAISLPQSHLVAACWMIPACFTLSCDCFVAMLTLITAYDELNRDRFLKDVIYDDTRSRTEENSLTHPRSGEPTKKRR